MLKILRELKNQFILDYHNNPGILFLECLGTITSLTGACTLALMGKSGNLYFILTFYLIGSLTWTVAAKLRNNSFNMVLSIGYSIINIIGLTKLFLGM